MDKRYTINFQRVLIECAECFSSIIGWEENPEYTFKYTIRAETLLELLEASVCGSIGGFDVYKGEHQQSTENPRYAHSGYTSDLFQRFLWIYDHYTKFTDKKKFTCRTMDEMIKYFSKKGIRA